MRTDLRIGDANTESAFLTDEAGYDVARLERYMKSEVCEEHHKHLLGEDGWQQLIDRVDAIPQMIKALTLAYRTMRPFASLDAGGLGLDYTAENLTPEAWADRTGAASDTIRDTLACIGITFNQAESVPA